jgi:phasin family protein
MATAKKTTDTNTTAIPSLDDLIKLAQQFKLPNVDIEALVEWQRKDIEALTEANRQAYEGMTTLAKRRSEILQQALSQWQETVSAASTSQNPIANQAEAVRQSLQQAMANFKELSELEVQTRTNAWKVVQDRMQENMTNLGKILQPKK